MSAWAEVGAAQVELQRITRQIREHVLAMPSATLGERIKLMANVHNEFRNIWSTVDQIPELIGRKIVCLTRIDDYIFDEVTALPGDVGEIVEVSVDGVRVSWDDEVNDSWISFASTEIEFVEGS